MQQHIHTIVKHFFQKDSLQEVSEQTLRQFTEEHPYSSVGHWLLAKKVHDTAPDRAAEQSAEAVAWFNNPLWLHWTLQEHEPVAETLFIPSPKEETVVHRYEKPVAPVEEVSAPAVLAPAAQIAEQVVADEVDHLEETEILIPGVSSPVSLVEVATDEEEEPATADPITGITPDAESDFEITETVEESVPTISIPVDEQDYTDSEAEADDTEGPEEVHDTPLHISLQGIENVQDIPAPQTDTPPPAQPLPGIAGLMEAFKPVLADSEEPVFEPYHTIDYFASLGVKLRQEDLKDKLGIQLKSFTEWLRGMKRITPTTPIPEEITQQFDDALAQVIQEIAGHSVEGKEVITEAMAEVWVKQGSKQKAIAIYEKLSLQNPAKSPYFATRIEQIKAL
ncbi:hypothetical protein [Paraflavitalea pollutisoli]|uniref:hypothetical protein n=1 Tax=Paraflavitalea pollutisoli TaxID=3034143 RepID=UPI0023EE051B|nr:hypothetical protein [Paraflavitalea sp. H1-2-19X]